MAAVEITKENIEEILSKNEIVLLDFWASWCGPCKRFGPIFEKASEKYPEIIFGKVNTEKEQELAGAFSIMSIPTIMAFRDNIAIFSQAGLLPETALDEIITKIKELDMNKVKEEVVKKNK